MVKKITLLVAIAGLFACSSNGGGVDSKNSIQEVSSAPIKQNASSPMIGGWAPVFFTEFDKDELNQVVDGQTLANNIRDYLQTNTGQKITMKSVELKDTDQVKYNLKQVIVTLYFN